MPLFMKGYIMNKEEIIKLINDELAKYDDIDDKLDYLSEVLEEYKDHEDFEEIFKKIYENIDMTNVFQNEEDPVIEEFINVLESTNDLILNEQYEEVITILTPYQKLADELLNVEGIDEEKFEICCFFNEIEKQLFYFIDSNPNKDIHLLNPYALEYYSRLGLVYHNSLKYNEATECYKKMLKFNPCSNQALIGMAYISYAQENYLTAIEYIKEFSKYAFSSDMIYEAYRILVDIHLQLGKYDYAAIFAMLGAEFAPNEKLGKELLEIHVKYQNYINIDVNNDNKLDEYLLEEEFSYMPNDKVMDVLYTMLLEFKNHENLKDDYMDMAQIILSLVDDGELYDEYENLLKEYN